MPDTVNDTPMRYEHWFKTWAETTTKQFEKMDQKVDKIDERTRSIETSMAEMKALNVGKKCEDFEIRMTDIEKWQSKMGGIFLTIAGVIGLVSGAIGQFIEDQFK